MGNSKTNILWSVSGASTTRLLHNLSTALAFQPGDELILSKSNHAANIAPWIRIAKLLGFIVEWCGAKDPQNHTCGVDELQALLLQKTRLITCPHAIYTVIGFSRK